MAWEWSHTVEAYGNAQRNVESLDIDTLRVIYAEWRAGCVGHTDDESETGFCERCYHDALVEASTLERDALIDDVWRRTEEQRTCDNGGFEAWVCPFGCHTVPFNLSKATIRAMLGGDLITLIEHTKQDIGPNDFAFEQDAEQCAECEGKGYVTPNVINAGYYGLAERCAECRGNGATFEPGILLTVATDERAKDWQYQTGDNSFVGGCYGWPHWSVVGVYRNTNAAELADEIAAELADLIAQ